MNNNFDKGIVIVSGPVKSAKSRWAERLIQHKKNVIYIATGSNQIESNEWRHKILKHKYRRPKEWKLIESADIPMVLSKLPKRSSILIDSLGGIITKYINLNNNDWEELMLEIIDCLKCCSGLIIIVSEEAGWGVCPSTDIGNKFRERLGELSDRIDLLAVDSWLVIHGRAINIHRYGYRV